MFSLAMTLFIVGIFGFSIFGLFMLVASIAFITEERPNYQKWLILLGFWLTIGVVGMGSYFWLTPPPL